MRAWPVVPKLWPESTVAIIASGPSLTQADAEWCEGRAHVIAVNDGIRYCGRFAEVLYSSDAPWWRHYKGMPSFHGLKYTISPRRGQRGRLAPPTPDIQVLQNTGETGIDQSPDGLRTGRNSAAAALNLAVHLGARRVVLLGCNMGPLKGQTHFFKSQPPGLRNHSPYPLFRRLFETMVEPLQQAGVTVLNCTPHSALTCFPRADLREVLP